MKFKKKRVLIGILGLISAFIFIATVNPSNNKKDKETREAMVLIIEEVATIIERELLFFETMEKMDDYSVFIDGLDRDFDVLEAEFSQVHRQGMDTMTSKSKDLVMLYVQLMDYHYMVLEHQVAQMEFEQSINELTGFLEAGYVTSNAYNTQLMDIMLTYEEVIDIERLLKAIEEQDADLLLHLQEMEIALNQIENMTEEDQYVHQRILQWFGSLDRLLIVGEKKVLSKEMLEQINEQGIETYTMKKIEEING